MAFTPKRRLGFSPSLPPSPAAFATPRSERRSCDLRWADGSSNPGNGRNDGEKEVNVQVVVRCRPLSDEEQRINVQKVIACNEQKKEVTVLQSIVNKPDKALIFDKVFGPKAQQRTIYEHAIAPFVRDVLDGFNCTVFAYGQTGTGKTYTMEGGLKAFQGGELSSEVGVIPRAVRHIFDLLDSQKADYSMKVTFLELYNEEITDLLAPEDCFRNFEERQRRPISLMEDGKGGAVIRGLQEEVVYCANDIFNLLECGSAKRRTADTLLNTQSSRSHSIFSITIHVKEAGVGTEEFIKCGRLNLVDLAGSENISRSGSREGKAREAGEINKSLLTLGRVITSLVEHSGHVPYRDSKLTRLLRESLGGKAKTCIIATISPSINCLEETMSTLDYAYRAKSIKNKPEVNQKLSKSVLLKDLYLEIERLKQDVKAAREKNGIYISPERFAQDEAEKKSLKENVEQLELDLNAKRKQANSYQKLYNAEQERNLDLESEIKECKGNLENLNREFLELQENYQMSNQHLKEKDLVISNLLHSEGAILEQAKALHSHLETASGDLVKLHAKIDQKKNIESKNNSLVISFRAQIDQCLKSLHQSVVSSVSHQNKLLRCMEEQTNLFLARKSEETKIIEGKIQKIKDTYSFGVVAANNFLCSLQEKNSSNFEEFKSRLAAQTMIVENFLATVVSQAEENLMAIQNALTDQKQLLGFSAEQQEKGLQRTLISTHVIAKTTTDFFSVLYNKASKLMAVIEENAVCRREQMELFKKRFQEVSAKEEKAALEKIVVILETMSTRKAKMLVEELEANNVASGKAEESLMLQLSEMQNVSSKAQNEWTLYTGKMKIQLQEDTFSAGETKAAMKRILQDCLEKVDVSVQQWKNAQCSVEHLNRDDAEDLNILREKEIKENRVLFERLASASSQTEREIENETNSLIKYIEDSAHLDHEAKQDTEDTLQMCSDQFQQLQGNHSKNIVDIRDQTESLFSKEYLVDHPTGMTPEKCPMEVPSFGCIEALGTPHVENLVNSKGSGGKLREVVDEKLHLMLSGTPRSPLSAKNL